ncbi:hypothetical protein CL622_06725 [archaeon]|nr:hypothetical protein [archaeon]|tara:strand:+ start:754 stop:1224 length:471 start_codon:yes stop_codon:yes gene_type:complete
MKRGYFFTLDAILALVLFTLVVLLVHLFYINSPPLTQLQYLATDTLDVLSNVRIEELKQDEGYYPFITDSQFSDLDTDLTVIEQMRVYDDEFGTLTITCDGEELTRIDCMKRQLVEGLYTKQYSLKMNLDNSVATTDSRIVVVSRRIQSGVSVQQG